MESDYFFESGHTHVMKINPFFLESQKRKIIPSIMLFRVDGVLFLFMYQKISVSPFLKVVKTKIRWMKRFHGRFDLFLLEKSLS